MINSKYLLYINDEHRESIHYQLMKDIYYFYNGIKVNDNYKIICLDNNYFNLSTDNMRIIYC